jgi:enoyl-CoA hydratase/carnithine racemase
MQIFLAGRIVSAEEAGALGLAICVNQVDTLIATNFVQSREISVGRRQAR